MLSLFDGSTMLTLFSKSLVVLNYELQPLAEERSVVNDHICHSATKFAYVLLKAKTSFLRYIGYLNFIKYITKHGLLHIQALVPRLNFLNY